MSHAARRRPPLLDLAIAGALLVWGVVATADAPRAIEPFAEIGAVMLAGCVALRTVAPAVMTLVAAAGLLLQPSVEGVLWLLVPALLVPFSATLRLPIRRAAIPLVVLLMSAILVQSRTSSLLETIVSPLVLIGGAAGAGALVARSRRQTERLRALTDRLREATAERERLAAQAERSRISRDLHDILAATLTTIVVQATAAATLLPSDSPAAGPVDAVAESGRQGLGEVRSLLALTRSAPIEVAPAHPGPRTAAPRSFNGATVLVLVATAILTAGIVAATDLLPGGLPLWGFALVLLLAFLAPAILPIRHALVAVAVVVTGTVMIPSDQATIAGRVVSEVVLVGGPATAGLLLGRTLARGRALRRLNAELTDEQGRSAALVAAAERARIARDLHDVLAHTLSSVTVQAGAAQQLVPAADPARGSVDAVAASARDAMREIRALLAGPDHAAPVEPAPSLGRVPQLVASAGARLVERGATAPVDASVSAAAFRLVQEALTNAHRHAPDHPADVMIEWRRDGLALTVENAGPPARPSSGGHGLLGMRERVRACAGELSTGPRADGTGWIVRATLPLAAVPA